MHPSQSLIRDLSHRVSSSLASCPTIVFIDAAIADYSSLAEGVLPATEVIVLDPTQDGVLQITAVLQQRQSLSSVHLVSHGHPGQIQLGNGWLNRETLQQYAETIKQWERSLHPEASLLIYGCQVGASPQGRAVVQQISRLIGRRVAASRDLTGSAALGGNWDLAVQSQPMAVQLAFDPAVLAAYRHILPAIQINDVVTDEGDSGAIDITFTISLDAPAPVEGVSVDFAVVGSSATAGNDFTAPAAGTLTFAAGTTTQTVTVSVQGDTIYEPDESFLVKLSNPSANATLAKNRGVGIILNDDALPSLSIGNVSLVEGNSGSTNAQFTLTLSAPSSQYVAVNYATADGTATATDYTSVPLTQVMFAPGEISKTINIPVTGDGLSEADETFFVNLSGAVNATIAQGQGKATLLNDDADPSLSIADVTITEGDNGVTNATFTVTQSIISGQDVTVNWATADDSALAGQDYDAASGTLTILAGQTSGTLTVPIRGDLVYEPSESFWVNLSNALHASIGDNQAKATITDNDPAPSLSIGDITLTEGNNGSTLATLTVSLSAASGQSVSVNYATADGTAIAGADYTSSSGSLTFAPGTTTQQISIPIQGDSQYETDESFFVNLSTPVGATLADAQAIVTLTNDDAAPTASIDDVTVTEGGTARFTISLSQASGSPMTVTYSTADSTATAGSDYTATTGTVTFAANETQKTIDIVTLDDPANEPSETFFVNLSSTDVTLTDAQGLGTITDNDGLPKIAVADVTVPEGNSNSSALITVALSNPTSQTVTVDYVTADGTALQGNDYSSTGGTLTFQPNQTTASFTVPILGDRQKEPNKTFFINLSGESNATLGDGQAVITILDDDPVPAIAINDISLTEGNSGTTTANFTVSLTNPSSQLITVTYATQDGTATAADNDYLAIAPTVLSFNPGETSKTIAVTVTGDTQPETDELFNVKLSNASATATIADDQGTATIRNDDSFPSLTISDVTLNEGNSGTTNASFTVTLSAASSQPVTVDYATRDGSATRADNDYNPASGTLTFAAGETQKNITIAINGDTKIEINESFLIVLSNPVRATLAKNLGIATLTNDDPSKPATSPPAGTQPSSGATSGSSPQPSNPLASNPLVGTTKTDILLGDASDNVIQGLGGNDIIRGFSGRDSLDGGDGDDQIFGGQDADRIWGRAGNDLLVGRRGDDQIWGGDGKDELYGGAGNDWLEGGAGKDLLTGGSGKDRFVFENTQGGVDQVMGFSVVEDVIEIAKSGFGLKGKFIDGAIAKQQLCLGARALDRDDRFIYNPQTGYLGFDADGSGSGKAIQLAQLSRGLHLTSRNLQVMA
ncbi:MAG TPA: Calx-beta domain-containing protein [Coleofasciculaceae cyanobacterium]